jgi:hypothetical protein
MKLFACAALAAVALTITSCGPSRVIRPIREGDTRLQISTGVAPIPISENDFSNQGEYSVLALIFGTSASVVYGINEELSGWAAMYPAFLFFGNISGEIGAVGGLVQPKTEGFGLSISPRMHFSIQLARTYFGSGGEGALVLVPQIDLAGYYETKSARPFLGVSTYFPPLTGGGQMDFDERFIPSINLGVSLKSRKTEFMIELKGLFIPFQDQGYRMSGLGIGFSMMWL